MSVSAVILAAGEGKRMKSKLPKVMHKIASRSMICHIIDLIKNLDIKQTVAVIGPNMEILREHILAQGLPIKCTVQENRLGTADAVKIGLKSIGQDCGDLLVLYGDTPFISAATIDRMKVLLGANSKNALVILGFEMNSPSEYGRLMVNERNELQAIIEYSDCTIEQREISLCNSGVMLINNAYLSKLLDGVKNNNAKKEYYLTDLVEIAIDNGLLCQYVAVTRDEAIAINSREELSAAEHVIQTKLREEFIKKGVTLIDKNTVYFSRDTKIENDVIIYPNVFFGSDVEVKTGAVIKSFSFLEGVSVGSNVSVGPFAYLRPGAELRENSQVGNFVEVKGAVIGKNTKVKHLSYIGDAEIGDDVNIGAGTVICNYDGFAKHKTIIGHGAFIGSNASLVAPVEIGSGSIVGAGSVITKNVPDYALSVARADQVNREDGASAIKDRKSKTASAKKKLL